MADDETTPLIPNDEQLYDEDGYSFTSETTAKRQALQMKVLYVLGIFCLVPIVWFFVFKLPNVAPKATDKDLKIKKVDSLPVYLHPILPKSKLMAFQEGEDTLNIDNYKYASLDTDWVSAQSKKKPVRRLILIGDIHGSYRELAKLMKKMKINHKKDHVLMLGDFISKGPDSAAVLNWAISNKVGCILGNHEFYILNRYAQFHSLKKPEFLTNSTLEENDFTKNEFYDLDDEMKIAKRLKAEQAEYLLQCPLITQLGPVPHYSVKNKKYKDKNPLEGIAVHAGLQWHIENLEDQDPETVLTVRAFLPPNYTEASDETHLPGAQGWAKRWNIYQKERKLSQKKLQKVFYGHNARHGLENREYSTGLDTGCVTGGKLSALEIWAEVSGGKIIYRDLVHQVSCS